MHTFLQEGGSLRRLVSLLGRYDLKNSKVSGTNHALNVLLCKPGALSGRCPKRLLSYAGLFVPTFVNFCNRCSHFLTSVFKSLLLSPVTSIVHQSPFVVFLLSPFLCFHVAWLLCLAPVFLGFAVSALVCTTTTIKSKPFFPF